MVIYNNSCLKCIYYLGEKKCVAYSDKIPEIIWTGKNKHIANYKNDGGIKYEPAKIKKQS